MRSKVFTSAAFLVFLVGFVFLEIQSAVTLPIQNHLPSTCILDDQTLVVFDAYADRDIVFYRDGRIGEANIKTESDGRRHYTIAIPQK